MITMRFLQWCAVAVFTSVGIAWAEPSNSKQGSTLRPVSEFNQIPDREVRSKALFKEAAKVITSPRCLNCHPTLTRSPTQGDNMHPHVPYINAHTSGLGKNGLQCMACHQAKNVSTAGAAIRSIPGERPWLLAPASMGWQGLSINEICLQLKDKSRNGSRNLDDIRKHMSTDHLVGWAWHPGEGRTPAPGTQKEFGSLISAWIETGAHCPSR